MRYTVLTYLIGHYEVLHEVEEKDPEAEYILVTDRKDLKSATWQVVYEPEIEGLPTFDRCYAIRFNPFKYCSTDICLRTDASIGIKHSLRPIIEEFEAGHYDLCLMPHPLRSTVEEEYAAWVSERGYSPYQAERCMEALRRIGCDPQAKGLYQGGFMIVRRTPEVLRIKDVVHAILTGLGNNSGIERLDQTILSAIVNKECAGLKVLPLSSQILSSYYMQIYQHGTTTPNLYHLPDMRQPDRRYVLGKEVDCHYLLPPHDDCLIAAREYELLIALRTLQATSKRRLKHQRQRFTYLIAALLLIIIFLLMWGLLK